MRVNVYTEEMGKEVSVIVTEAKTGKKYPGVRFILKSAEELHHTPDDDDRSAVTFWFHDLVAAERYFEDARRAIQTARLTEYGKGAPVL